MRLLFTLLGLAIISTAWPQATGSPDYFAEGSKAIKAKNYTLAVEHFKRAVTQKPQNGEA